MVKGGSKNSYLRRYKACFLIGLTILSFQILLVANFLTQNRSDEPQKQWEPSDSNSHDAEFYSAASAARNLSHLKLDDLEFDVPCTVTGKEALSAISRAKSQKCKQEIVNVTCLALEGKLYPSELKSKCPKGYFGRNKVENSPQYCIKLCLQSGFPYAGVQYSIECFCGADEPPSSAKVPDSSCNMKCPGNQHATCGGYYTINIYQTGIKKFIAQIANDKVMEAKPVKIVFLLTLNGRALRQVRRLIKLLYHRDHYYYIHVDIRQDYLFRELLPLESLPNVRLTRKRFATIWGGASLLEMLRSCMNELLNHHRWSWDFVLNLSESDYPVKTVQKLTSFLSKNKMRNFVKSHGREVQRFIQKQGLDKTFVECETRMWRVGNRKLPAGVQIDGGSDWVALSRRFVEYVAGPTSDDLVSGLLTVFRRTLLPAESFFHTALRNSEFCDTYVDNNLHVTNWKRKLGCKCQYRHVVDWCGCSPNDFRPEDWPKVLNTSPRPIYFARKFEPVVNQAVILRLELWLFGLQQPSRQVPNLDSYWQSVYHHLDLGASTDAGLIALASSVGRLAAKTFAPCGLSPGRLLEIYSFHRRDAYEYSLFSFDSDRGAVEVAVRPVGEGRRFPFLDRVATFTVSTDYDQKEQISRNFPRVISPLGEPVLAYRFEPTDGAKTYNLTCLWVDPAGVLRDATAFTVDDAPSGYVRPNLKPPHTPGAWLVKIVHGRVLAVEIQFPVIPTGYFDVAASDDGPDATPYAHFLPGQSERAALARKAEENSRRRGEGFVEWTDSLVNAFYAVEKACTTSRLDCEVEACTETWWSSRAPDPKSAIDGTVNETTGTFDVW
ncbi:xylosyltransferase oxt isoform X2 [Cylas formicarius]|uniref:xylosyltransferase oxt isoform X2 n=1 Tax=Cylas formicarius TaxID=197179 RepID=UPI0029586258|nr:xylosyltransferase oxt isoform X2 [Cylas formicarius]